MAKKYEERPMPAELANLPCDTQAEIYGNEALRLTARRYATHRRRLQGTKTAEQALRAAHTSAECILLARYRTHGKDHPAWTIEYISPATGVHKRVVSEHGLRLLIQRKTDHLRKRADVQSLQYQQIEMATCEIVWLFEQIQQAQSLE